MQLRRAGFRFIALADDNFYTVTLTDIKMASLFAEPRNILDPDCNELGVGLRSPA